ncbi:MAG: GNAT family N-acetyltransferase [Trueperaceae bacterium]|nr:GNAT family N-acetyltransferase [Trueperaceae bacterium]
MSDAAPPGAAGDLTIRELATAEAARAAEALQQRVWGFEPIEVVPQHVLLTAQRHGGLLLGAWRGPRLLGVSFGFLGRDGDVPALCSHLLGTDPDARGLGVGVALKWAQREGALARGVTRIVWTFDPLEHGNARLNTSVLGGTSNRYVENLYGDLRDELNAGLPSDRLEVVWDLEAPRVAARAAAHAEGRRAGPPAARGVRLDPEAPWGDVADPEGASRVRLGAPRDVQGLRTSDPEAAAAWRGHLRRALPPLFEAGYVLDGAGFAPADGAAELWLARAGI